MGCCTSQINHDLEMAIQKVKEVESQSTYEEEYVVPPRYMYLKKETPFLVPPLGKVCIYSKCLQDLKSVLERAKIKYEKEKGSETFQQLYIEAKKLFEKYETSHQRDMQIIKAATNRAKHEQPSNLIIINLLKALWQTQKYGINSFERTNCIYTLLNVSENLIHYFLEINNTNSFEKIDEENITSLKNFFQGKDATNVVDLTECCCQWIQIAKKEPTNMIMSKFQIFKQFTDDVSKLKEFINARIELAKILDPTFLLDANARRALATYAEIDVIINNCLRLQMNPNNEMMKKAMEIRHAFSVEILHKELEKTTSGYVGSLMALY